MNRADAVALLRRLHDAQAALYAGGEEAPVRALLTDDVHWHVPGRNAIAGDYHGIHAVLAYFRRRRDLADRTFRIHPVDVLVGDGDRIAALVDGPPCSAARGGAGPPSACTGSATAAWRPAGCCRWTRTPSTTSGRRGPRTMTIIASLAPRTKP
jgi:SnoaL-like domain